MKTKQNSGHAYFQTERRAHDLDITDYVVALESYFVAFDHDNEVRFYQSPGQKHPYKMTYVWNCGDSMITFNISLEGWAHRIWERLQEPEGLRKFVLMDKQTNFRNT